MVIDFNAYPFLKDINSVLEKEYAGGVTLQDLIMNDNTILNLSIERIKSVVMGKEQEGFKKYGNNSVFVFYTIVLILSALNDRSITKRYINSEARIFYNTVSKEQDENLIDIAKGLGLKVSYNKNIVYHEKRSKNRTAEVRTNFCLNFVEYLQINREENEELLLSKQILKDGYTCLTREKFLLLLQYSFKNRLNLLIKPISLSQIPGKIKELLGLVSSRRTPPCIENIEAKYRAGQQLNDNEIITYAIYMRDIGYSIDSIKAFLSKTNFSKAEELVQQIKKKRVIVYSCEKMKELNLCVNDCGVKNPLRLYYRK
ncbi:MAG: hypothetical protein OWQ54_00930 [Sulfolobaceae archaeon]|nr:hypothetical protein [Sulfolobaceae archaeon]